MSEHTAKFDTYGAAKLSAGSIHGGPWGEHLRIFASRKEQS